MRYWVYKGPHYRQIRGKRTVVKAHSERYIFRGKLKRGFLPTRLSTKQKDSVFKQYYGKKMTNVRVRKGIVEGNFDNKRLKYPYLTLKHLPKIGTWSTTRHNKTIKYDSDVKKQYVPGLLVHESVEQYLQKNKGLPYERAHKIATKAEELYVKRRGGNWRAHQISVLRTPG